MLEPLAHRHVVLTIPRLLRPLFRRRRELLTELARAGAEAVSELVRRGLLASHAISRELVAKLLAWRHPGFSAHVGEAITPEEKQRLLSTPEAEKPPPVREILRIAEHGEGWGVPAEWE